MKDKDKTKAPLAVELDELRQRFNELQALRTRDKQETKELEETQELSKNTFELSPDGIMILDIKGVVTSCNKAYFKLTGFSEEEIIGKHFAKLPAKGAESISKYIKIFTSLLKEQEVELPEFTWTHKDGTNHYGECRAALIKSGRRIVGLQAILRDITERKKAEEALKQNTQYYTTASRLAHLGYWDRDFIADMAHWSSEVCRIFGVDPDEFHPTWEKFSSIVHPSDREQLSTKVEVSLKSGEPLDVEYRIVRPDGMMRNVHSLSEVQFDDNGQAVKLIGSLQDITERKQAEETLVREKLLSDSIVDNTPAGILFLDNDFVLRRCNYASSEYLRTYTPYTGEQALGMSYFDIAVGSRPQVEEWFQKVRDSGQVDTRHGFKLVLKQDGQEKISYWDTSVAPVLDTEGKTKGILILTQDVTAYKKAGETLQLQAEMITNMIEGVILVGMDDGVIHFTNPRFEEMFGYKSGELVGKNVSIINAPTEKSPEETAKEIIDQLDKDGKWQGEVKNIKKDGTPFWCYVTVSLFDHPVFGRVGVTVHTDITERKQAEEALRESQKELSRIYDSVGDVLFYLAVEPDDCFRFLSINQAFLSSTGLTQDQIVGKRIEEVIPEPSVGMVRDNYKKAIEENRVIRWEEISEYPTGVRVGAVSIAPFFDDNGICTHLIGSVHDITESKQLEEEREKSVRLETVGTLAGGIAHDFNNILTGIMGNIGLARRAVGIGDIDKTTQRLEEAEKASIRAKDLTQQLLTFSRGGVPIKKSISIAGLLKESVDFALRGSNVICDFDLPENLWPVEVDEGQTNQVIANLIINTEEAMPEGGVIKISASNTEIKGRSTLPLTKGEYVKITVTDQGVGIQPEHLSKIFDPYFTTKQKGSGLGLATTYSIIRNHGGHITVESTVAIGTTFSIYLPASGELIPTEKEARTEARVTGTGRVLVMDDDELVQQFLYSGLTGIGYEVVLTKDGAETIECYTKAKESGQLFDVVIMDLTIPGGMGGKEAINKLLAIDPGAKVIVSSGYSTDPVMADFKEFGFSAVIAKPYIIEQLGEALHDLLGTKK